MPKKKPSVLLQYGIAVSSVAVAVIVRLPLQSALGNSAPFLTFFPGVLVSAVYGGFNVGLVATALSGLAANYFFVPPTFSFTIHKSSDIANLMIFLVIGGFISKLGGVREQANRERIKLLEQDLRTRKQLKEVRDQFFDVIENTSDGFFMVDREWRYTYVNRKGVEIVRKSKEELLGHRLWDVFPEAVKQKDYWELHRAMEESVAVHYENFSDSYNIWYEVDVYPSQEGISIFARDITERKQAEKALRQSEERFRLAARAVAGIVYDWNFETGEVYRSEGLYRLIGVHPDEVPQTRDWWYKRIHSDDLASIEPTFVSTLSGDADRYDFEYRVRHEDGHWVYLWDRGYLIRDQNGQLLRVVGSSADITNRKRDEQERKRLLELEQVARAEAEAANRIKDEFLAVLSHELRSPLNPILGWAKLLQSREFDKVAVKKALSTIERNAQLQAQLIEDLLDVSRILQGKLSLNMAAVNLSSTIQAALETVRLAAEAKNIYIHTKLDTACGQVLGDLARLQQVVWNLLSNAVKFTPEGGRVDIRLEHIGSHAQITVSDTGKGIHPNFLPYVFETFRQADSTTTRKFGGLGLGLAIVRHLVELHGGTVDAQSLGEGQGATFTVRLPLIKQNTMIKDTTTPDSSTGASPTSPLAGINILVVDDDQDNRDFLTFVLEDYGALVRAVTSAAEALQVLAQSKPDILLSDIGMPEMDGYMLIQQVRALETDLEREPIPAIALTAYAGEINQQQALKAGFQQHMAKPIAPEELLTAISSLIKQ
jgi:PAS domain S-box-containing protein